MNIYQNKGFSKGFSEDIALGQRAVCFSIIDMSAKDKVKVAQSCLTLRPHGLYSPWNSPAQNTGVGSCSLLRGIFPTQGLNPGLPYFRWILYQMNHQGSPFNMGFEDLVLGMKIDIVLLSTKASQVAWW